MIGPAVLPTRAGALLAALALGALAAAGTRAAPPERPTPASPVVAEVRGGRVSAAVDVNVAFGAELRGQLSNGLTNVIVLHAAVLPERGGDAVALSARQIEILYDVWEESYGVAVKDSARPGVRSRVFRTYEELRAWLADVRDLELGPATALGRDRWVVQARVELNPVSQELLERTRELLANPAAAGRGGAPSRSVLGAMAGFLLRSADPGAVVRVLRSAAFSAEAK